MEDGVYNNESQVSVITLFLKKTQPSLTAQPKWYTLEQRSLKQRMVAPVRWHTTQLSTRLCCSEFSRFINAPFTVSYTSSDHSAQFRCTHLSTSKFSNLQNMWITDTLRCTVTDYACFYRSLTKTNEIEHQYIYTDQHYLAQVTPSPVASLAPRWQLQSELWSLSDQSGSWKLKFRPSITYEHGTSQTQCNKSSETST